MTCPQRDTHCSKRKMDKRSITSAGIHCGVQVKKKDAKILLFELLGLCY